MTLYCNGHHASVDDLAGALTNYGHFTSLQVRGGAVQGLDLHLQRLQEGTEALFGTVLDAARYRPGCSTRCTPKKCAMPRCG
ncbi:hypothetical protein V8017_09710 [Stenotrophomonas rhizophila]